MPDHPLLIFPEPSHADRALRHGGSTHVKVPAGSRQAARLTPQFHRLQLAMDRQRLALQNNPLGIHPEQVLVLETVGPIQNFINAVKRIQGLEWLGELELDDIPPDHGFADEQNPQKPLKGQLFLVMTDQRALQELQNLFTKWKQNNNIQFPYGLAPLKNAFTYLHTIRPWDAEDRIRDTGLLEDWKYRAENGQEVVPFEVELWFREKQSRQQQAEAYLKNIIESLGGEVVQQCVIPQIAYHGVLSKIPIDEISGLLSAITSLRDFRLLQCEDIMHLRPVGQCAIRVSESQSDREIIEREAGYLPAGNPIVALFDGLPMSGHKLLDGRLIIHDPDGFEGSYQAKERVHGTAMASLICHGDLNSGGTPSKRPVYVRPILQPHRGYDGQFDEGIPENILPVDLIHRAVRRLFETEGTEPPAAPTVRVINLSVCNRLRPFDRAISSWARLLDWLSWKYNVLFIVSAGNHDHDLKLNVPREEFRNLTPEAREKAVIQAIAADTRNRRLLSPSETVNGLTIAATHADASSPGAVPREIDPIRSGLPSAFSAHGPGYLRMIKPEILLPGGRMFFSEKLGNTHPKAILQRVSSLRPPGQAVAAPGSSAELDKAWYMRGTSNAAALASRSAMLLYDVIETLRAEPGVSIPKHFEPVLLKTLLVHGAAWDDAGELYESILRNSDNTRTFREYVARFLGYGAADIAKAMKCTDQRATIIGTGELGDGAADEFILPFPPSLSAVTQRRRLTVTLSWLTPVNNMRQDYRIAHLWLDAKNDIAPDRICADYNACQRGTVQHEVLQGEQAVDFQDGKTFTIKVNCRTDAGEILEPIPYALAVTLEVAEGINIPIYEEVRDRLRVRVPVRGGASR